MKEPYHIYCISGLAADQEILQNLRIHAPLHYVHWIKPQLNESFESYILRLKEQIVHTDNLVLIGVSLGGMVAISLNKYLPVEKTILISSIKNHGEKPPILKNIFLKPIEPLIFPYLAKTFPSLAYWAIGAKNTVDKAMIRSILKRADNYYLRWCIQHIIEWDFKGTIKNLFHIHGTNDRIFGIKYIQNPIKIEGGTHFVVFDRAEEVSNHINRILAIA